MLVDNMPHSSFTRYSWLKTDRDFWMLLCSLQAQKPYSFVCTFLLLGPFSLHQSIIFSCKDSALGLLRLMFQIKIRWCWQNLKPMATKPAHGLIFFMQFLFFCISLYKMCAQLLYESVRGNWMQGSYLVKGKNVHLKWNVSKTHQK